MGLQFNVLEKGRLHRCGSKDAVFVFLSYIGVTVTRLEGVVLQ